MPGTCTTRSGTPSTSTGSVASNGPTTKATRYVLITMVDLKRTTCLPSLRVIRPASGPFETASRSGSTMRVISKTALNSGSSKHGNARRQSVACIWVVAMTRSTPWSSRNVLRYQPRSLSLRVPVNSMSMVDAPGSIDAAITSRSVLGSRWNGASAPPTFTEMMCSSSAFKATDSTASFAVTSIDTVPEKDALTRSGSRLKR